MSGGTRQVLGRIPEERELDLTTTEHMYAIYSLTVP
jgi:hypothetical protein